MAMAPETLAAGIYHDTVDELDGKRTTDVETALRKKADALEDMRPDPETQAKAKETVGELSADAKEDLAKTLHEKGGEVSDQDVVQTQEDLREAADIVGDYDEKVVEKDGDTVADAQVSVRGSAEFDLQKTAGANGLPDAEQMRAVVIHEKGEDPTEGHENQVQPDANAVKKGDQVITQTAFVEVAPIIAQVDKVPKSLHTLSNQYRTEYYADMLQLMPDRKRLKELSMKGQFRQFAKEIGAMEV